VYLGRKNAPTLLADGTPELNQLTPCNAKPDPRGRVAELEEASNVIPSGPLRSGSA
jgi:hypothetical protein